MLEKIKAEKINQKIKQKIEERLAECEEYYKTLDADDQYRDTVFGELHALRCVINLMEEVERENEEEEEE